MSENTAGTWDQHDHFIPGVAVTHTMDHYAENGPPFCMECSNAAQDWVRWPCGRRVRRTTEPYPAVGSSTPQPETQ